MLQISLLLKLVQQPSPMMSFILTKGPIINKTHAFSSTLNLLLKKIEGHTSLQILLSGFIASSYHNYNISPFFLGYYGLFKRISLEASLLGEKALSLKITLTTALRNDSHQVQAIYHPYCIVVTGHSHLKSIFKFQVQYLFLYHLSQELRIKDKAQETLFLFLASSHLDCYQDSSCQEMSLYIVNQPSMEQKAWQSYVQTTFPPKIFLGNTSRDS